MPTRSLDSVHVVTSGVAAATLFFLSLSGGAHAGEPGRVTDLLTQPLANVPGKEVTLICSSL